MTCDVYKPLSEPKKNILIEFLRQLEPKIVASTHIHVLGPNDHVAFINGYQSQTTMY